MMKRTMLLGFVFQIALFPLWAGTSVWKVESNGQTTYLGGTCHVLRSSDYPLPDAYSVAYEDSETLVFETEIDKLDSLEVQQMFLARGLNKDGLTLEKILSPRVFKLLVDYCESANVPVFAINGIKPPLAVLTLLGLELQRLGVSPQSGVDKHFFDKARKDGKKVEWVESVEEQVDFVFSMGQGYEDEFVEYSIRDLRQTRELFDSLVKAWREGDEKQLVEIFVDGLKTEFPELHRSLLVDRNERWLPRVEEYLSTSQNEFILVGVAHLVGEQGILRELESRGYKVAQVETSP
jgi:uncharacterized protein YbaP (TraB family)